MAMIPMEAVETAQDVSSHFTPTANVDNFSAKMLNGIIYLMFRKKTSISYGTALFTADSGYRPDISNFTITSGNTSNQIGTVQHSNGTFTYYGSASNAEIWFYTSYPAA